jgi:hypothetical protein
MLEKITLDMLTRDSVSVKTEKFIEIDGVEYQVGEPHRRAYVNSLSGRAAVATELPEAQAKAIMAVWGETPTIQDGAE